MENGETRILGDVIGDPYEHRQGPLGKAIEYLYYKVDGPHRLSRDSPRLPLLCLGDPTKLKGTEHLKNFARLAKIPLGSKLEDALSISAEEFNQDLREPRISRTVGVDPGLAMAYTDASIAKLDHPMLLIALGHKGPEEIGIDVGPNGSGLSDRIKDARFHALTNASHFSFLGLCKRDTVEIFVS